MLDNTDSVKKIIYEKMNGFLEPWCYDSYIVQFVEDEFADGMPCEQLYRQVYDANCRLCDRLGVAEDSDVELIIDCLLKIAKQLSMKMYDYGAMQADSLQKP